MKSNCLEVHPELYSREREKEDYHWSHSEEQNYPGLRNVGNTQKSRRAKVRKQDSKGGPDA